MSKATHTPGPWDHNDTLLTTNNLIEIFNDRDLMGEEPIADVYSYENADKAKANARLIAAAPELLEALGEIRECLAAWMEIADPEDMRQYDTDAINKANAAIEKATGEPK